jgi:hypothetical protein
MTAYRFRVKYDPDPTSLWRDIVVGRDRTLEEVQQTINPAFGLDQDHLWFFGRDEAFWDSDVKYQCPREFEDTTTVDAAAFGDETHNAAETTIATMARQLGLEQYDRICYLFDYGDEWRFYAILKEILEEETSDKQPAVVNEKGDSIDQYDPPGESEPTHSLPTPLDSLLPASAVPTADLRDLETRDDVVHVIPLLSIETGFGTVCERFLIQYEDAGYVLENFKPGWQVVDEVPGEEKSEEELLGALADAAREWHAEIAEMSSAMTGQQFDERTVEAMHVELEAELERKGFDDL